MVKKMLAVLLFSIISFLPCYPTQVELCPHLKHQEIFKDLSNHSSAIFVGKFESQEIKWCGKERDVCTVYEFRIDEVIKGNENRETEIKYIGILPTTRISEIKDIPKFPIILKFDSLTPIFNKGDRYLIFADLKPNPGLKFISAFKMESRNIISFEREIISLEKLKPILKNI